jgi:hypothetical protein
MTSEDTLFAAYDAGERAAKALAVGDTFTGAVGAAVAHGITDRDSLDYRAFRNGFLYGVYIRFPRGVLCSADNQILQIG